MGSLVTACRAQEQQVEMVQVAQLELLRITNLHSAAAGLIFDMTASGTRLCHG
jgi:hypothetical protein